jgi:hypothetical protein
MRFMLPLVIQPAKVDLVLEALDRSMEALREQGGTEKD